MSINSDLHRKIVQVIQPHVFDGDNRAAIINAAFWDSQLRHQIDMDGAAFTFAVNAVSTAATYGELESGKLAIVALLETISQMVGTGTQAEITALITQIESPAAPSTPSPSPVAQMPIQEMAAPPLVTRRADDLMPQITVTERARPDDNHDGYTVWSLHIDAPDDVLKQVEHVRYELHPTFADPTVFVKDRDTAFKIERSGWGVFAVGVEILFNDGSVGQVAHQLTFESDD